MFSRRRISVGLFGAATSTVAEPATVRKPLPPRLAGGKPLMAALNLRRSIREYSEQPLPEQVLSDLLRTAYDANRTSGRPCGALLTAYVSMPPWPMVSGCMNPASALSYRICSPISAPGQFVTFAQSVSFARTWPDGTLPCTNIF